jgi:hypothetical protein
MATAPPIMIGLIVVAFPIFFLEVSTALTRETRLLTTVYGTSRRCDGYAQKLRRTETHEQFNSVH